MAKITRYTGNVQPPAANAVGTERTIFGGITQADDLDSNLNADLLRGWGIVPVNGNPTKQDFNAMGFTLGQLIAYLHQAGVAEWDTLQEYPAGGLTQVNGQLYISQTNANIGNNPIGDNGTNWIAHGLTQVNNLTVLGGMTGSTGRFIYLKGRVIEGDGGEGIWQWDGSNLAAEVTADTQKGVYIPPTSDTTGANGAWVRQFTGPLQDRWFGVTADGVTEDTTAFIGINSFLSLGLNALELSSGEFLVDALTFDNPVKIIGPGPANATFKAIAGITGPVLTLTGIGASTNFGWAVSGFTIDVSTATSAQDAIKILGGINQSKFSDLRIIGPAAGLNMDSVATCQFSNIRIENPETGILINADNGAGNRLDNIFITGHLNYGIDFVRTTSADVGASYWNKIIIESADAGAIRDIRVRSSAGAATPVFIFADIIICDVKGVVIEDCQEFYFINSWFGTNANNYAMQLSGVNTDILRFIGCRFVGGATGDIGIDNNAAVDELTVTDSRFGGPGLAFALGTNALTNDSFTANNNWYFTTITNDATQFVAAMNGGTANLDTGLILKAPQISDQILLLDKDGNLRGTIGSSITLDADAAGAVSLAVNGNIQIRTTGIVPTSASDTGIAGQLEFDSNYIYRCVATNTWKRVAISTW